MPEIDLGNIQGPKGDKGDKGEQGIQGVQGEQGPQGIQGVQGVGIKEIVFKSQTSDGGNIYTITLTNDNSYDFTAPIGPQGIQGPKGEKGETIVASLKWNDILEKPAIFSSTWETVSGKPTIFPTNWSSIANIPATLPSTWENVSEKPTIFPTNWANVADKPTTFDDTTAVKLTGSTMTGNLIGQAANTISGFGKVYNAVWNDYAEFFERGEETEPGDIVGLDLFSNEEKYVKASKKNFCVVGVHSDSFAHLIGGEEVPDGKDFYEHNIKKFIPVGLAGRVKCKVIGNVKKGDYIGISDIPGVGKISNLNQTIVGVALENKKTENIGLVKILIRK